MWDQCDSIGPISMFNFLGIDYTSCPEEDKSIVTLKMILQEIFSVIRGMRVSG
jgi:hypothetical protein